MKIVIFVDGGVVTTVLHNIPAGHEQVDVLVADYDNGDGLSPDADGYMKIKFDEGAEEVVQAGVTEAESDPDFVDRLFRQYWDN